MESSKLIQEKISYMIVELMRLTDIFDMDLLKEIKDMQRIRNSSKKEITKEYINNRINRLIILTDIFDMDLLKEIKDLKAQGD